MNKYRMKRNPYQFNSEHNIDKEFNS